VRLSRRSILLLLLGGACDSPPARSLKPNDAAPTPVPILPTTPFRLAFAPIFRNGAILLLFDSLTTRVVLINEQGEERPVGARVSFVSRNPDVVTVDSTGTIVARAMGTTWILASAPTLASTDSIWVGVRCTLELGGDFNPSDPTIRVGESFVATVLLWTCGRRVTLADTFTWHIHTNPQVVEVDSTTGRITGRAPGTAWVYPVGRVYRSLTVLRITVLPAL
jgi:hypothetical protein